MTDTTKDIMARISRDFARSYAQIPAKAAIPSKPDIGDPNCPICGGIGFVSEDLPVGDPNFGKMSPCVCRQNSIDEQRRSALLAQSNLSGYKNMTFENFNISGRGQLRDDQLLCLRVAYDHARKFATDRQGWLMLMGNYGTGKTHLAASIANQAVSEGIAVLFQPVPDLLDWLRGSYEGNESYESRFTQIISVPLLILDDFGTQSPTAWAGEKLYQIINTRYINRLPTVITTNNALKDLDGRIRSRLDDPDVVVKIRIMAPDYRNPISNADDYGDLSTLHLLSKRTFANFDLRRGEKIAQEAVDELYNAYSDAKSFAENPQGWLVLSGPNGVGKTHLAAAIGNYQTSNNYVKPLFRGVPDLLDHLRATFSPTSNVTYDSVFDMIRNAPLLILDHLSTANAKPWASEKLYQILDYRYIAEMPTVITTALPVQELDSDIRSRIIDFQVCKVAKLFSVPMYSKNPAIDISDMRKINDTRKRSRFRPTE